VKRWGEGLLSSCIMPSRSLFEFPVGKRAITEEKRFGTSELPLVKRYACEQTSYSGEKIKIECIVQELGICNDKVSSFKSYAVKYEGPASSLKMSCENLNNLHLKDVPDPCLQQKGKVETVLEPEANIKPLSSAARNLTPKIHKRRKDTKERKTKINSSEQGHNYILFILLPLVFVVTAAVVCNSLYFTSYQKVCEMTLDIGAVRAALENNIFGQKAAVYDIISVLNVFCNTQSPGIVILAFAGGTGVGKSYTTSIISRLYPWKENVKHFVWPLQSSSLSVDDVYVKFSPCGANLVIIDDLVTSDAVNIVEFLQNLVKHSQHHGIRAIVILVFSGEDQKVILQGNGDVELQFAVMKEKLTSIFQDAELEVSLITFHHLQSEHIAMCIKEALNREGIALLDTKVEEVMALLPQGTGCKGVASKVQLLVEEQVTSA
jgi:hypothetical protein